MRKKRKLYGALLIITAVLIMQIPVSEADAAASASDFQMKGSTLVRYTGASENVSVPSDVEIIGESAFEGNSNVKKVSVPNSVKAIKEYAFWDCDNLETVILGSGLTEITDYSFANCKGLRSMTIPTSVRSIGIRAFEDCVNLTEITIPREVTNIHDTAFDGCVRLTINSSPGTAASRFAEGFALKQAEMPEYEDVPGYDSSQSEEDGQEENGAETAAGTEANGTGNDAPEQNQNNGELLGTTHVVGNQAVVFMDNTSQTVLGGTAPAEEPLPGEELTPDGEPITEKGFGFPKYTIVDSVIVADQAYYRNGERTDALLPEGIAEIGEFSFARSGLTQLSLPEGVDRIGYGAFYHCDDLWKVTLPESLEKVEPKAFEHTVWVKDFLKKGREDFLISGGVLVAYRGNSYTVDIPVGVRIIAAEAFAGHSEIYSVTLPESLTGIGEGAFENCSSLQEVKGGNQVTEISDRAFAGCPLVAAEIGPAVQRIGLGAFDFTDSAKDAAAKTAVFSGTELPAASYETSASRLSNETFRKSALQGVLFAVVEPEVTEEAVRGSVLGPSLSPFQGITGSIGEDGGFYCRFTNLTAEALETADIPDQVYLVSDDSYHPVRDLENIVSLAEEQQTKEEGTGVVVTGTVPGVLAELEGAVRAYELAVREAEDISALEKAYQRSTQTVLPAETVVYDLVLTEPENRVPLTKLGNQVLTVMLPVPEKLTGQEIQILTLDRNGQTEALPAERVQTEEGSFVRFTAQHLSLYALLGKGERSVEAEVLDGEVTITEFGGRPDASPNTGDAVHLKYYLGTGLLFAGAALAISGRRGGKNIKLINSKK